MRRLAKVGGQVVDLLARYNPNLGAKQTLDGNFQSFADWAHYPYQFSAYTGMWGVYVPGNENMVHSESMDVYPAVFPVGTTFRWDVPDPGYGGIEGYLAVAYGNYDNAPSVITPKQVSAINALTVDAKFSLTGDGQSGLLCEFWLSSVSAATGAFPKDYEIAYFPRVSPASVNWINSNPKLGPGYVDSRGVDWKVVSATSGDGLAPYLGAYRPNFANFEGPFDFKALLNYLIANGHAVGNKWFNGLAYGVEPYRGKGSLTIDKLAVTYN